MNSRFDDITWRFIREHPDECAYYFFSWWQIAFYIVLAEVGLYLLLENWLVLMTAVSFCITVLYLGCIVFRLTAIVLALSGKGVIKVNAQQIDTLHDDSLPIYTILVPLYKEANIANSIIASIERLDYPSQKLDVKLLLEADDQETIQAVRRASLGAHYDVVVVADSQPKTKPKACNVGLTRARGMYVVIFDAEDRPEADQLKKAVFAFQSVGERVACLQAKLNYYNARQNRLTRWFTIEYTMWFDLLLPGLQRLGAPIPLGGTSNHFRTDVLRQLGGWDPFNVTEDCDLGIRICKLGYSTEIIESTTWEEANSQVRNWINQRSRWMKGFFQTHIAHMRHPIKLAKSLGPLRVIFFWLTVGGVSLTQVLNLIFWAIGAVYLALLGVDIAQGRNAWTVIAGHRNEFRIAWKMLFWGAGEDSFWSTVSLAFFLMGCVLLLANGLFVVTNCLACMKRGNRDLLPAALLSPFYWVLISIAAWKGFWQLFTKRFYWEKTVHGLEQATEPVGKHLPLGSEGENILGPAK